MKFNVAMMEVILSQLGSLMLRQSLIIPLLITGLCLERIFIVL
jgi:hypothetical protein